MNKESEYKSTGFRQPSVGGSVPEGETRCDTALSGQTEPPSQRSYNEWRAKPTLQ